VAVRGLSAWFRPLLLVGLIGIAVAVALAVGLPPVDDVRAWVGAAGWAAPVAYAGLYALLSLTPTPVSLLSVTAGVLFGLAVGLPAVLAGALGGALAAFGLSRLLGRDTVERLAGHRVQHIDGLLRDRGLLAMIAIRFVPLPFTVLNLACGLTAVRWRDYALGTAIGVAPGAAALVTIGTYGAAPGSAPFLLAVGGLAALSVAGVVVTRRRGLPVRGA
jgi:uncharacterized membrane protein YdjX (TVP38/TMEM64 family)